jgi:hypothetical protein
MANIKITSLTDIGANLSTTTLVPVVDMLGTPITMKANLQVMGNLILNGAGQGANFVPALRSLTAGSVTNAAQSNITSVGTLSGLTVTATITGNINGSAASATVAASANSVAVANVAGIGNIATLNIDGVASNILYGNGVFAPAGAATLAGDGGSISNIAASNVVGTVGSATVAASANAVAGANVSGNVARATVSTGVSNPDGQNSIVLEGGGAINLVSFDNFGSGAHTLRYRSDGYLTISSGTAYEYKFPIGDGLAGDILKTDGVGNLAWSNALPKSTTTVGALPSFTGNAGMRSFVTDANLIAVGNFGATVGAGGSNNVPVFCDGSAWLIG